MTSECLNRNIPNKKELTRELKRWCAENNRERSKINWSFTRKKADKKLSKHYVS